MHAIPGVVGNKCGGAEHLNLTAPGGGLQPLTIQGLSHLLAYSQASPLGLSCVCIGGRSMAAHTDMCSVGRHVASTPQACSKQDARCAQAYSRDVLAFVFAALTLVAAWTSTTKARAVVLLNRQQTEEWKGWMQARAAHNALPAQGGQQAPA